MKKWMSMFLALLMMLPMMACGQNTAKTEGETAVTEDKLDLITELGLNKEEKDATEYTVQVNSAVYSLLDFADTREYENATRGLIDAPEVLELKDADGNMIGARLPTASWRTTRKRLIL